MINRIQVYTIFLVFLAASCFSTKATGPQAIVPLADTYIDSYSLTSNYGRAEYLEVSNSTTRGFSFTILMFNLSEIPHYSNVSVEAKLLLYGSAFLYGSPTSSYAIGVHWCVNTTWDEDTLTYVEFSRFVRTKPESVIAVGSEITWYEWKVTDIVNIAIQENYDKLTLVLEAEEEVEGNYFAQFFSKDQQQFPPDEASPQLVFTYHDIASVDGGVSWDMIAKVMFGVLATAGIVFVAYRFLRKPAKKRRRSSYTR